MQYNEFNSNIPNIIKAELNDVHLNFQSLINKKAVQFIK